MKVLILKNKISKSLKSEIKDIVDFYSGIETLEITEKKVSLKPEYEIQKYYTETGTIDMDIISQNWLKNNVPSGYDIVVFISKEWRCDFLGGFSFIMSNNPKLIIVRYVTGDTFTFAEGNQSISLDGDNLTWTIKHELSHALCNLKQLPDLTHKYYLLGTPRECFKTMNEIYKPKYFKIQEWVSEDIYKKFGEKAWQFLDQRLLKNWDYIREKLGPVIINKYSAGLHNCGFDSKKAYNGYRETCSQHTMGRAGDGRVIGMTAEEVRNWLQEHYLELPEPNIWVEKDVNWVHLDVRYSEYIGIHFFSE